MASRNVPIVEQACWRGYCRVYIWRHFTRTILLLLLACILFVVAACGDDEEPTPAPTDSVATQAADPVVQESPLPMPTMTTTPLIEPTPNAQIPATNAEPSEQAATPVTVTVTANGSTAIIVPLEVDEGTGCEIESSLDVAGYPDLEQKMGCALDIATFNPIGINEFGPGPEYDRFMLWFSDETQIYVLYPDNKWETFPDTWEEGEATFSCNPLGGEEDSPPLPRRGFGKLWCSDPNLQDVMGTVEREERLCQHAVLQQFETGRLLACFEDASIRYFRLLDNHTWDLVVQ